MDENKHEYKQIYEEYLAITKNIIEARLKESYRQNDDTIQAFYDALKDDKTKYEEENSDTMEMLYGVIDFDNFKVKMVEAKKGMVDNKDAPL